MAIDIGMRFKEFIQMSEETANNQGDKGLMGFTKKSSVHVPSDGQPFKNLGSVAGQEPRPNQGGAGGAAPMGGGGAMFMKKMRKRMKRQ